MRYLIATAVVLASAVFISAQTNVITNDRLAKYRDQRLEAEKQLRENYEKLGFPSPEELAKRNAADEQARLDLFKSLQAQRLERERLESESQLAAARTSAFVQPQIVIERQDSSGYLFGYSGFGNHRVPWRSPHRFPFRGNVGWRVAGGMVIYDSGGTNFTVTSAPRPQHPSVLRAPRRPGNGLRRN